MYLYLQFVEITILCQQEIIRKTHNLNANINKKIYASQNNTQGGMKTFFINLSWLYTENVFLLYLLVELS